MPSVAIHPPKTPVTKGSNTFAAATVPNVCKMPGPPAPFVPTPLPNIARSSIGPEGYSTTVKIEGKHVAIRGASFKSIGDIASKGTGGGLVSMNVEGPAKFIAPGSLTVQIEGKNVHLLSDVMCNNNGPSGNPPNAATMTGAVHVPLPPALDSCDQAGLEKLACECNKSVNNDPAQGGPCPTPPSGNAATNPGGSDCTTLGTKKHKCCEDAINKHVEKNPECGFRAEVVYPEDAVDAKDKAKQAYDAKKKGYMDRGRTEAQAIGYCRRDKVYLKALYDHGAKCIADVVQGNPATAAYDFKFNCAAQGTITKRQLTKYRKYVGVEPKVVHADGSQCNQDCG